MWGSCSRVAHRYLRDSAVQRRPLYPISGDERGWAPDALPIRSTELVRCWAVLPDVTVRVAYRDAVTLFLLSVVDR
jgi:hypothetical protein